MNGHMLKVLRVKADLTQEELAEELGTTRTTIGNYEQGKSKPNLDTAQKLVDILGDEAKDIFFD